MKTPPLGSAAALAAAREVEALTATADMVAGVEPLPTEADDGTAAAAEEELGVAGVVEFRNVPHCPNADWHPVPQ